MLLTLLLAASPFPPPSAVALENCARAACTSADDVRVCKCLKPSEQAQDLIVVDRPGDQRVVWSTTTHLGEVTDFRVQRADLDADGAPELLIASLMSESDGMGIRTWDLAIVDGNEPEVVRAVTHDFGFDALKGTTLQLTEWAWQAVGPKENGFFFIGREYGYRTGALVPSKAPVLRRRYTPEFEKERAAAVVKSSDRLLPGRAFLAHASTTKGADEPPKDFVLGTLKAITIDEPEYELHAEDDKGQLVTFTSDGDASAVLRLGDLKNKRLYPLRYWPASLEKSYLGRHVLMGKGANGPSGVVFVQ